MMRRVRGFYGSKTLFSVQIERTTWIDEWLSVSNRGGGETGEWYKTLTLFIMDVLSSV